MPEQQVTTDTDKSARHWLALTPDRLVVAMLVVSGSLLAFDHFGWIGTHGQKGWPVFLAVTFTGLALLYLVGRFAASLLFGRQFQFHLRTLLLLVLAVAGLCSWMLVQVRESQHRADATAALRAAGMDVHYDLKPGVGTNVPKGPQVLRENLGDAFFSEGESIQPSMSGNDPFGPSAARKVDDDDFQLFKASAPNATRIRFPGTKITDAGLVHLQQFSELEVLELSNTGITDIGLVHLEPLTSLRTLHLDGTRVTDAGMAHLAKLVELRCLYLDRTAVGDMGVKHLIRLPALESLRLEATLVTDKGMKDIAQLEHLTSLTLSKTQVTDGGLEFLGNLQQLQSITLRDTAITDAGFKHLHGLTELQWLNLRETKIADDGMMYLEDSTKLEVLFLDATDISDVGLEPLRKFNVLRVLGLQDTKVTDAGLKELQELLPNCKILVSSP